MEDGPAGRLNAAAPEGAVLETARLRLRRFSLEDAAFARELVNDPGWIAFIGERNVRSLDDARAYLGDRVIPMYERHGYGMYLVELRATGEPVGTCGLVRREGLEHADLGFAFLERFRGRGYAHESAAAVLADARDRLGLARVVAIVTPANARSIRLLEKLGLRFERMVKLPDDAEEIALHVWAADPAAATPRARPE